MNITRMSEYFINEYFLMNKKATVDDFKSVINSKVSTIFQYHFKNTDLLIEALTHKSFSHEAPFELRDNERLEFLGDAVLDLIVSDKSFKLFSDSAEGELSKLRSTLVNEVTLSHLSLINKIDHYVLLGKGEVKNKGYLKASVLSDCFEAIVGAIFLDAGYEKVRDVVCDVFAQYEKKTDVTLFDLNSIKSSDPKSKLQEITMKELKLIPKYESEDVIINKVKQFKVSIKLADRTLLSETNISKKKAMQNLAQNVLTNKLYTINKG